MVSLSDMNFIVFNVAPIVALWGISYFTECSISMLSALALLNILFALYAGAYVPGASSTPLAVEIRALGIRVVMVLLSTLSQQRSQLSEANTPIVLHKNYAEVQIRENRQNYVIFVPYHSPSASEKRNKIWTVKGDTRRRLPHYPGVPLLVTPDELQCDRIEITDVRNHPVRILEKSKSDLQ